MSGVHNQMLSHVVRRGVAVAQQHFAGVSAETVARLQYDAQLYENAGPEMEMVDAEFLPVVFTGLVIMLFLASVRSGMAQTT
jgi:hypothetical protein